MKDDLIQLVAAIRERGRPLSKELLHRTFDLVGKREVSLEIARRIEYDLERGRLDETVAARESRSYMKYLTDKFGEIYGL